MTSSIVIGSWTRKHGHPFTIAYIDCDTFKAINDRHGHRTGDALLCAVATILQRGVRTSDIVARLGGDEFVIGFVETDSQDALTTVRCAWIYDPLAGSWPRTPGALLRLGPGLSRWRYPDRDE